MSTLSPTLDPEFHAVDAFRSVFRVAPRKTSEGAQWRGVTTCLWRTPWLDWYELPGSADLVIGIHTGGSRSIRTRLDGEWSPFGSQPGDLAVIPPGTPTAYLPRGEVEFLSVHIEPERLRKIAGEELSGSPSLPFRFAFRDPFIGACVQALGNEMLEPRERGSLFVDSVTDALALHVVRSPAPNALAAWRTSALPRHVLARVCERIEESLETGVSLDDLAREAGASRFHFARAFRDATGLPPHRYLTQRRIERAKELLLGTERSLVEIGLVCGFGSQSHFTARFRELVGVTPKQFRGRR